MVFLNWIISFDIKHVILTLLDIHPFANLMNLAATFLEHLNDLNWLWQTFCSSNEAKTVHRQNICRPGLRICCFFHSEALAPTIMRYKDVLV